MTSPTRVIFPPKRAGEFKPFPFDFTSFLAVGETISEPTITVSVWSGVDANPSAVYASSTPVGAIVDVYLQAGVVGVIYLVQCSIVTSTSNTYELDGLVAVIPAGM
jgi:hypothetical protein